MSDVEDRFRVMARVRPFNDGEMTRKESQVVFSGEILNQDGYSIFILILLESVRV